MPWDAYFAEVATFTVMLSYPDRWRDYSTLHLEDDSYATNVMRTTAFEWRRTVAKLDKPMDRTEGA